MAQFHLPPSRPESPALPLLLLRPRFAHEEKPPTTVRQPNHTYIRVSVNSIPIANRILGSKR